MFSTDTGSRLTEMTSAKPYFKHGTSSDVIIAVFELSTSLHLLQREQIVFGQKPYLSQN